MQIHWVDAKKLDIKSHPALTEKWVQERIAKDPSMLGLEGQPIIKDLERRQPRAGRLDMLLQDADSARRYVVELQLGELDESHLVRAIEYWDIERKRFPQFDHVAVVVAEYITSRFLNVVSLFNATIPLIAIQMNALEVDGKVTLVFTKVLDEYRREADEEDDESTKTDRAYWETIRGAPKTVAIADKLLGMISEFGEGYALKYNKFYIGLARGGLAQNFVIFRATKEHLKVEPRLPQSAETQALLESEGLDAMDYDARWGRYRIRVTPDELKSKGEALKKIMKMAHDGLK